MIHKPGIMEESWKCQKNFVPTNEPHRHLANKRDGSMRVMLYGQWSQHVRIFIRQKAVVDDVGGRTEK